jgi:hypothetical protein
MLLRAARNASRPGSQSAEAMLEFQKIGREMTP